MIDVSTIQTFPIPKDLLKLQQANSVLTNQNTELTIKSSNLILGLVGVLVFGALIYRNLNNQLDEQNYNYQK